MISRTNVLQAISPKSAAAVQDVRYHGVASLTLLVWESIVTSDDEVQYIWIMRNRNPFKWIYFFLRYVTILAHIVHNVYLDILSDGSNPPTPCFYWWAYIVTFTQLLGTCVEFILSFRVFAFFNKSKKVALLLSILIVMELGGTARLLWMRDTLIFHETCLLMQESPNSRNQGTLAFVVHCALITLTLFRYFFVRRAGWGRTPLVSLMIRDSSMMYIFIFLLNLAVMNLFSFDHKGGVALVFWATAFMSISGCRLIASLERYSVKRRSELAGVSGSAFSLTKELEVVELGTIGSRSEVIA